MTIKSINPYNNEVLQEYTPYTEEKLGQLLEVSEKTFKEWRKTSFEHRKTLMLNCMKELLSSQQRLAKLIALEMGKPLKEALSEVQKCAGCCEYYAANAEHFLKDEPIESDASKSFVTYQPLGAVLAIMPWNFPFWQVIRFAAPSIMAGNVALLKHASNVPQCALALEELFRKTGFPEGVFQILLIGSEKVEELIGHKTIKAVTLTGSDIVGAKVASAAGKNIKKAVMELGGSDPFIVRADADLPFTVQKAVDSRLINTGQSCIAAKRFIVNAAVYDKFIELLVTKVKELKVGDPFDEATSLGPLARPDLAASLYDQVKRSVEEGAKLVLDGGVKENGSAIFYPVILADVKSGMTAYSEELFGPVFTIIKAENDEDAIAIANDSRYGLGSSIWTKDSLKAEVMAKEIESGSVFINGIVKSDSRLPFGGIKNSGYGRELSEAGIKEFVNIKTVWIK